MHDVTLPATPCLVPPLTTCQPVFVAYCTARGLQEGDVWKPWEFLAWCRRRTAKEATDGTRA